MTQSRSGGQILVDQLCHFGTSDVFLVPGESFLPVLDALRDSPIEMTVCRQEGGAAMMAEATGKLTGRPGIAFVTRGPGATNASAGIHIARQDSTPMLLFIGQVDRSMRGREAFQELDYPAVFGSIAKGVFEVDRAERLPEIVSRAFVLSMAGRPGPVVVALPEDVLSDMAATDDIPLPATARTAPDPADAARAVDILSNATRPVLIVGGSRWTNEARTQLIRIAEHFDIPVMASFRRQDLFPNDHPNYVGDLGVVAAPYVADSVREADVVLLLGGRMSEIASQGYTLLQCPVPRQTLIHVHPGMDELGRVYVPDLGICADPGAFLSAILPNVTANPPRSDPRTRRLRGAQEMRQALPPPPAAGVDMARVVRHLSDTSSADAVITNGAGNYATWVHRFYSYRNFRTQLAPTSGSMGYGLPAAIAAARVHPGRHVVAFAGDGCFLMTGQEFATAVQHGLRVIVIVCDNGMYGTIRMHQERAFPGRVSGTSLTNPDFAAYARAFGGYGERIDDTDAFPAALERAIASQGPAILHCVLDPDALTVDRTLTQIRAGASPGGSCD